MRLENFSLVQQLCLFASKDAAAINVLADVAGQIWEGKLVTAIGIAPENPANNFIIQQPAGTFTFKEDLYFEFFYSIHFLHNQLTATPGIALPVLSEAIFQKTFRDKRKEGSKKLSYDFPALCLVNLHNWYQRNILEEVKAAFDLCFQQISGGFDKAFPFFHATAAEFYSFIRFMFTREEETFLNSFALAVNGLCAQCPDTGSDILDMAESDANDKLQLVIPAIMHGLTKSKGATFILPLIIQKLKSGNETQVKNALFILSHFEAINQTTWDQFGSEISEQLLVLEDSDNHLLRPFLPGIYIEWLNFIPSAREYLVGYSASTGQQYQAIMSGILWLKASVHSRESWYEAATVNASAWNYGDSAVASNMQFCLFSLVEQQSPLAIKFLDAWIENESNAVEQIKMFSNDIMRLFANSQPAATSWLTSMFRSENERFHLAIRQLMGDMWVSGFKQFTLDQEMLSNYSFWEVKYVLFKILGYVDHKDALESLAYSLLERKPFDEHIAQLVTNAFTQHICYNYGGTYSFLREKMKDASPEVKMIIKAILDNAEAYFEYAKRIRSVNELKWLKRTGKSFTQMRMKKMSEDFKQGLKQNEKNSVRSLFKNISLKGGKKFFSKHEGSYTYSVPLQNFGSSFDLPMGELIDPVKEAMNRIQWQEYKMKL